MLSVSFIARGYHLASVLSVLSTEYCYVLVLHLLYLHSFSPLTLLTLKEPHSLHSSASLQRAVSETARDGGIALIYVLDQGAYFWNFLVWGEWPCAGCDADGCPGVVHSSTESREPQFTPYSLEAAELTRSAAPALAQY